MKVEQELKGFVQAVADASPEPPLLDPVPQRVRRRLTPVVALAAGFAAALVLVGWGAVWMFADDADTAPTGPSDPPEVSVSPTKQDILADGVVTEAEYRAAVDAVVGCSDAVGIDTSVRYDSSGIAVFDSQGIGAAEKFDACFAEHLGSVAHVWAAQNASPESEIGFYNDVVDCVEAQTGESYGDVEAVGDTRATDAAISAAPDIYGACLDRIIGTGGQDPGVTDTDPQGPRSDPVTSTTSATTTTTVSQPGDVTLSFLGLGSVEFGASEDPTIKAVTAVLGAMDEDTGWVGSAQSPFGVCGGDEHRLVRWGQLGVLFTNGPGGTGRHFAMYDYGDFINASAGIPMLATQEGVTVGDDVSEVLRVYGDRATFFAGSEVVAPYIRVSPTTGDDMILGVDGTTATGTVNSIRAGFVCGE